MPDDPRLYDIVRLLHEYVSSPSLRRILQPDIIRKLALKILHHADGPDGAPTNCTTRDNRAYRA